MYEKKIPEMLDCGLMVTLKVIGGKWKSWIINCITDGIRRPSAIHRVMHNINPRIINLHLKELEEYGIICKKIYAETPARVGYQLTGVGESLLPVITMMEQWGNNNKAYIHRNNVAYREGSCVYLPGELQG